MSEYDKPPIEEDIRSEDHEFNPALEPSSAKAWLNLLQESEDAFEDWNLHCDNIDKQYASLERLAQLSPQRNREFALFWANCEVLKPSIYAKPPVPVVVPKFKDRRAVYQSASEMMERCCNVAFDLTRINDLMLLVRDDLSMASRGVAWCRYESGRTGDHEKVCVDFKARRDFLHSISRNWREVTWVAGASYLTRSEARERFQKYSGDAYQEAEYRVDKDSKEIGGADARERAKFWEIWHRGSRRVVWVAHGVEDILDEDDPHLKLQNFFPCPKPAFGTVQRGSLIPVPDVMQYRDQLDEVNLLTGRIHALSDALEAKGFYPAGGAELADAIQAAVSTNTPGRMLVPIANWAAFGGTSEVIIWLPIDMISQTITALVMLRKQIIEDIYQIMGLSDIMRGATDPEETLGAQQLKTQYGSTRIRDKQQEMVRLARDLVEIVSEIITEKFDEETIIEMSQMQLPTQGMVQQAVTQLQMQIQQQQMQMQQIAQQTAPAPAEQVQPPMQQDPSQQASQQMQQQLQQSMMQMQEIQSTPTIEQVMHLLRDGRAKSFILDIETDSTIMSDENGEKQRRSEFIGVLGQLLPQLAQMITSEPGTAEFCGELLKFATAPFRAGRSLDGSIDNLVEMMKQKGAQGKGEDPTTAAGKIQLQIEQMKQVTAQQKNAQDLQIKQAELQQKDLHKQWELQNERAIKLAELQSKQQDADGKLQVQNEKMMENREAHQAHMLENQQKMQIMAQKANLSEQQHQLRANDMQAKQADRRAQTQFKMTQPRGGAI